MCGTERYYDQQRRSQQPSCGGPALLTNLATALRPPKPPPHLPAAPARPVSSHEAATAHRPQATIPAGPVLPAGGLRTSRAVS
jgi:hypothetical protein